MPLYTRGVTSHAALTGLSADDHTQYLLTSGSRTTTGVTLTQSASSTTVLSIAQITGAQSGYAIKVSDVSANILFGILNTGTVDMSLVTAAIAQVNCPLYAGSSIANPLEIRSTTADGVGEPAFVIRSNATFTADNLVNIKNNTTSKWRLSYAGVVGITKTSSTADPSTTEYPTDGDSGVHKNTTSGNLFYVYNDGGAIKKAALT